MSIFYSLPEFYEEVCCSWNLFAFSVVHWEYTTPRVYESSFCSCSDIAALKPQHQLNINQILGAKFMGPAKLGPCCKFRQKIASREHP